MLTALLGSWRKGLERIEENSSKIASFPSQKGRFWVQTGTGELLGAVSPQAVLFQLWELSGAPVTPIAFFLFHFPAWKYRRPLALQGNHRSGAGLLVLIRCSN